MKLTYVNRKNVLKAWPLIEPLIQRVCDKFEDENTLTVLGCILKSEYICFVATDENNIPQAVATVEIVLRESRKCGKIIHVAGNGKQNWLHFLDDICEWCKAQGCIAVEGTGRVGWEKVLAEKGFKRTSTTIRKQL